MDIEWGKDGATGELYILQARPETVQSRAGRTIQRYSLKSRSKVLVEGPQHRPAHRRRSRARDPRRDGDGARADGRRARRRHDGSGLGAGDEARLRDRHQSRRTHLPRGDHRARARHPGGGRLRRCHARRSARARMSRSPAPKARRATSTTASSNSSASRSSSTRCRDSREDHDERRQSGPRLRFRRRSRNRGVGLARLEFIINRMIGVHPRALLEFDRLDGDLQGPDPRADGGLRRSRCASSSTSSPKASRRSRPPSRPSR